MRLVVVGVAVAAMALSMSSAEAQILGFGREREVESVLTQVRNGAFAERCANPVEEVEEEGLEAYDLVDLLVGAPDGARYNVNYAGSRRTDARLDQILQRFVRVQAPPSGINVRVNVEDTPDIDARQSSAGQILITMGLIDALQNRPDLPPEQRAADLAFVLAHEYSHVVLCHYNRSVNVSRNRRALRTASALGLVAVALTNSDVTRTAAGVTVTTDGNAAGEDYLAVMAGLTVLRTLNSSVVNPAWSRQQERDADRLAVELMAEAGYPPIYVSDLLTSLHAADEQTTNSFTELATRLPGQTVNAFMFSMTQNDQRRSFRQMLTLSAASSGLQAFQQWRTNQLRHFHDPPERRMNWITPILELRSAQLGEQDQAALQQNSPFMMSWADGFDTDFEADRRAPELAETALQQFATADVEAGCTSAAQALTAGPTNLAALMASGQCEISRANYARAARHFRAVETSTFATPSHFEDVATMWTEAEQRPRAEATLTAGTARFPERFYMSRMYLHAHYEEYDRVTAVAAECGASSVPQAIKDECARTARDLEPEPEPTEAANTQTPNLLNPLSSLLPRR